MSVWLSQTGNSPNATQVEHQMSQEQYTGKLLAHEVPPHLVNTDRICGFRPDAVHNSTAGHCSQNLSYHVEKGPEDTHLTADQEAQGDGRIQVGTANVTYTLCYGSDGQAKGKRHFQLMVRGRIILVPYHRREADKDVDDRSQRLGEDGPPEHQCFNVRHDYSDNLMLASRLFLGETV